MPFTPIAGTPNPERIDGTQHRNLLTGDAGSDTLGGWGDGDRVLGQVGEDHILLQARLFAGLTPGVLAEEFFSLGVAVGSGGQFVYRGAFGSGDGLLLWNANGSDVGGEVLIARLAAIPALTATDLTLLT